MNKNIPYILHGKSIQWIVTSISTSRSDEWTTMYSQNFSYTTSNWETKHGKSSWSSSWNSYKQWDSIDLVYSQKEDSAIIKGFFEMYGLGLFLLVWLFELLVAIYLFLRTISNKRLKQELLSSWKELQTEIISVDKTMVSYNKKSTYRITSQALNENDWKIYVFKSEHLFFKPSMKDGEKISVFVKPLNYKKYYMDIRKLEEKYVIA